MRKKKGGGPSRGKRIALSSLGIFVVLFGIVFLPRPAEKAIHHLIESPIGVSDEAFPASVGHLVGAPLIDGNRVEALQNGDAIFPAMLAAIRGAKQSITVENFIFRSGKLSEQLVGALSERATAGVKVHVIVDAMGSIKLDDAEVNKMKGAGVDFVKYNQTKWHKLLRVNHRDHRKIVVVDGRVGFTGGACLADEWMGAGNNPKVWRDTHFKVEGPVVAQLQGVFMDNWIQTHHRVLQGPAYFPPPVAAGSSMAHCFKTGPRDGVETARLVYLYSIAAARQNIRIIHSYFVPDDLLIDAFLAARKRGVKIEVVVPGIIDANIVRRASRARWDELLDAGVEFYEFQPAMLHCKVMVVDDIWVVGGTVNFDNRSFRINDENCFDVWDKKFAATQIETFEADKQKSRFIKKGEFRRRPWYVKAAEHFAAYFRAWL